MDTCADIRYFLGHRKRMDPVKELLPAKAFPVRFASLFACVCHNADNFVKTEPVGFIVIQKKAVRENCRSLFDTLRPAY
jgi:hypothetical protein